MDSSEFTPFIPFNVLVSKKGAWELINKLSTQKGIHLVITAARMLIFWDQIVGFRGVWNSAALLSPIESL